MTREIKSSHTPVQVEGLHFRLCGRNVEYRFHVDDTGDLVHDYYGSPARSLKVEPDTGGRGWGLPICEKQREFPTSGQGDFRLPAIHIRHGSGTTVTHLRYQGHEVVPGKIALDGLPATWGSVGKVTTLVIRSVDTVSRVAAELFYSVFPELDVITRSIKIKNESDATIELQRLASFTLDTPGGEWEMVQLNGDWSREAQVSRHRLHPGIQGFQNSTGFSSHNFNPFFSLVSPETTEVQGPAYGFNLIWSGSFAVEVEQFAYGRTRAMIGLNPLHLAYPIAPGASFQSPEAVSVYSAAGLGGMSRSFHRLYREHLCRSTYTAKPRPVLLNSWEAVFCDFDADSLLDIAKSSAQLDVKLFVLDDGWFGNKHPRVNTRAGLGDWVPNAKRFPLGFSHFVDQVTSLQTPTGGRMHFGLWVEPEMLNPASDLYEAHPDWVLHSGTHERSEKRWQLVLDLSRREVQDYILESMTSLLRSADIRYIKWDCNRGINELASPAVAHDYILGLYRILEILNERFPEVLFEGCASGGGRFDAGILYYWPQSWTSDNTDGLDRIGIQLGTSLVYPPSSMGCHVSACPNEQVGRTTPFEFRAHVAMMGGSFGFELDPNHLGDEERRTIPQLISLAEMINPVVVQGDLYRIAPDSNRPAALHVSKDGDRAVLFAFQIRAMLRVDTGAIKLHGLEAEGVYEIDGVEYDGLTLRNAGLKLKWEPKDYQSKLVLITRRA